MKTIFSLAECIGKVCLLLDAGGDPLIVAKVQSRNDSDDEALLTVEVVDALGNEHFEPSETLQYGSRHPVGMIWWATIEYDYYRRSVLLLRENFFAQAVN